MKRVLTVITIFFSVLVLQGCAALVIGAGGTTAKVAADPRTTGTQIDDSTLYTKVMNKLNENADSFTDSRIIVSVYNGKTLLIGQVKSQAEITKAIEAVQSVDGVNEIYSQLRIGKVIGSLTITNDAWITTKVKANLVGNSETKARDIKVVTENGEVFLMGIVSREEGKLAGQVASKVSGVSLVTTIFTYSN